MQGNVMWWEILTAGVLVAAAVVYVVWFAHRSLRRRDTCSTCGGAAGKTGGSSERRLYQLQVRRRCDCPEEQREGDEAE
jgi:hypothetical protein